MASGIYTEQIFTERELKRAAVLLTFGARLCSHMPLEWVYEYPSLDAYLKALHDHTSVKPTITFNFDLNGADVRAIVEAYDGKDSEDKFVQAVKSAGLDPKVEKEILLLHSKAVAENCRECLDGCEYLIERRQAFPSTAKWIQVRGRGRGEFVRFGYDTSKEMRADLLNKIR
jgi:hypothetical protein